MSNGERMDEQLRRFLVWQADRLDGTPDAHGMSLRIGRRSATRSADRPRLVWTIVAVALVAALAAAAALVGSRLIERPPTGGLLAYGLNDDIYLADHDGAHPKMVADGVPWTDAGGGPSYLFGDGGPAWAPDGRHFLFYDLQGAAAAAQLTGHIADASGHLVASIPNIWVDATWSPDSTRIEAWTGGSAWIGTTQISIYGTDGALQESLPLPTGYVRARELPGFWAPDGRSVYVRLDRTDGPTIGAGLTSGVWQLPVDGSAPRSLSQDDLIARSRGDVSFSRDGSRMVANDGDSLVVANADGTVLRAVGPAGSGPIWSPTGTQVAYVSSIEAAKDDIQIVDIASGTDRTVVAGLQVNGPGLLGWSPAGDRILFAGLDQKGSSLWSVNADGTDRALVVAGADGGYWQPVQTRNVDRVPASISPTAEPSKQVGTRRLGHLAYGLDGDIYMADWDGRNPVQIAGGAPVPTSGDISSVSYWGEGPMWSPDGRHLAYRSGAPFSGGGTVYISDPAGHVVASFPGTGWLVSWSPDSTRVVTSIDLGKTFGIYGLDGVRQALLTVPAGYQVQGDYDPVWSPDGLSLLMLIAPVTPSRPSEIWELPIDGRTPRRVPDEDPRSHRFAAYSRDGARTAFIDYLRSLSLVIANADGTELRVLAGASLGGPDGPSQGPVYANPVVSPTGDRVAYIWSPAYYDQGGDPTANTSLFTYELRVIDVASGTVTTLARSSGYSPLAPIRFSPEGDRLLFWRRDANNVESLWGVKVDGSDARSLVPGTGQGDWQWLPAGP